MKPVINFSHSRNFNTGNYYTQNGQPISWAEFELVLEDRSIKGIVYQDHARGITNCIPLPGKVGHTMYEGEHKPHVIYGNLDDSYVRACERAGLHHSKLNLAINGEWLSSYDVERAFQALPKGEIVYLNAR